MLKHTRPSELAAFLTAASRHGAESQLSTAHSKFHSNVTAIRPTVTSFSIGPSHNSLQGYSSNKIRALHTTHHGTYQMIHDKTCHSAAVEHRSDRMLPHGLYLPLALLSRAVEEDTRRSHSSPPEHVFDLVVFGTRKEENKSSQSRSTIFVHHLVLLYKN